MSIKVERIGQAPFAPAPKAVRAGDYIYTSSIYPIDDAGHALSVDEGLGLAGPSLSEVQARRCLEQLRAVLRHAGSSIEGVLKAGGHPAQAAGVGEVQRGWKVVRAANPPARPTRELAG